MFQALQPNNSKNANDHKGDTLISLIYNYRFYLTL
jgi:hypothetical protein